MFYHNFDLPNPLLPLILSGYKILAEVSVANIAEINDKYNNQNTSIYFL